jgi:hypothetical protein
MPGEPLPFRSARRERSGPRTRDIKEWVRAAACAPDDATIMVSELSCSEPGCPPFEVVMAVLRTGESPVQKKLHMRLADLSQEDVTRAWTSGDDDHHQDQHETKE